MRFRRRDHEGFIGGYDPEHEMPDPYRRPRGPWQSEAYRDLARDSRYAYRWDPDRFEERMDEWRRHDREDFIQPRDRYAPYGFTSSYDRARYLDRGRDFGFDRGYDREYPPRRFEARDDYARYFGERGDPW